MAHTIPYTNEQIDTAIGNALTPVTKASIGLGNVDNTADANKSVNHASTADSATNVTGTVAVANGGTGATTLTSGQALIGNGTGAITTRAITDAGSSRTGSTTSQNLITERSVVYTINGWLNRTNAISGANTAYTTYMARGEALFSAETNPTANGAIAWKYE